LLKGGRLAWWSTPRAVETTVLRNPSLEKSMKLFTNLLKVAFVLSIFVVVPACNTMEGAGKDTQRAGEKMENAADRNK
jgi:predicted small secreted protein